MTTITKTKQPGGLHSYMVRWNELAEKATTLGGIRGVKVHTSEFESYVIAERRVAWLEAQIAAMGAATKVPAGLAQVADKQVAKASKKVATKASKKSRPPSPKSKRRRSRGQQ